MTYFFILFHRPFASLIRAAENAEVIYFIRNMPCGHLKPKKYRIAIDFFLLPSSQRQKKSAFLCALCVFAVIINYLIIIRDRI